MPIEKTEKTLDFFINALLKNANIACDYQNSSNSEIAKTLSTASKAGTGEVGHPEFIAVIKDFVIIIENKKERTQCIARDNTTQAISTNQKDIQNYAVNGAVWYAKNIIKKSSFKKVFAIGCAGTAELHTIQPTFVAEDEIIELPIIDNFDDFNAENIENYYRYTVLKEIPPEKKELEEIIKKAKELHEHLRNYGGLGEDEKPLVVSAILLALREQNFGFKIESLIGDQKEDNRDGDILFAKLKLSFDRAEISPDIKKEQVLSQFSMIKTRAQLNQVHKNLDKTPLKYYTEYINEHIYTPIVQNSPEDYLGRFYGEFVSYSGGDGQSLGVVLTPRHITDLFCELVNLKPTDTIFDPCCGTGGFLIAGMHNMLKKAVTDEDKTNIKQKQIYGVEIRDDMFAIATTNMILRGDGQSNLMCGNFLEQSTASLQDKKITVGFMNPPYSQAKTKETSNLSELSFIQHLLSSLQTGGRACVIVPISTMIGKTKEDKQIKSDILSKHTLDGVISLNKNTFYGVGTVPCIAVFTAGQPHPSDNLVKFINFEDDGFEVRKHLGLVETLQAKQKLQLLLAYWRNKTRTFDSKFMVETTIDPTDEWVHSFYYYNDEIPTEKNFEDAMADYLTFEYNMTAHRRECFFKGASPLDPISSLDGELKG